MAQTVQQQTYQVGDEPVSGYRLEGFLGRGGFGEVWRATGPGGVLTALKIIRDLDRRRGGKELKALRLLRDIRHPNLVPLTAFWLKGEAGNLLTLEQTTALGGSEKLRGTMHADMAETRLGILEESPAELVIAMGLAEKSLFDRLQETRDEGYRGLPVEELLTYLEDSARAIDLLNSRHEIQHCDIKPQNILLLSGAAQVCDFGLAKAIGEVRETSMGAGTIAYGAPEILMGDGPTSYTDQYSLAISYIELRTGELPYASERISDVLEAKEQGHLELSQLTPAERAVLEKAAAVDPADRFTSCCELVAELRACFEGGFPATESRRQRPSLVETRAARTTAVTRRKSPPRERRWQGVTIGIALTACAAGGAAWWNSRCPDPRISPAAEAKLAEAERALLVAEEALQRASKLAEERAVASTPGAPTACPDPAAGATAVAGDLSPSERTAQATEQVSRTTVQIADSLDALRSELRQVAGRQGEIGAPASPVEHFHNAVHWESCGDHGKACIAYAQMLREFQPTFIDPYLRIARMLDSHQGGDEARQTLAAMTKGIDQVGTRLAHALLAPREERRSQLLALVQDHPEHAPAVYELSRSYAADSHHQDSADRHHEKVWLERFLQLHSQGHLHRHFLDTREADRLVENAQARLATLRTSSSRAVQPGVRLAARLSKHSWSLHFTTDEPVQELWVRVGEHGVFESTGYQDLADERTGARLPNLGLSLPLDTPETTLAVKYRNPAGREMGPFEVVFSPEKQRLAHGKQLLHSLAHDWIAIRPRSGKQVADWTQALNYRFALREIRYGFAPDKLDQRFALPPWSPDRPYELPADTVTTLEILPGVEQICVQLVFADGEETKVSTFRVPTRK